MIRLPFAAGNTLAAAPNTTQPVDPDALSPEDAAVEAKLDQHLDELRYNAVPVAKVFDAIAEKSGVKIEVDWAALDRAGIAKDAPVTAKLHDLKASKALKLVFKSIEGEDDDHKLGFRITGGVIHVSTRVELDKLRVTRSFDVTDLVDGYEDRPVAQAQGMKGAPLAPGVKVSRNERFDEIIKFVTDNVDTNSWKDNGGDVGEISGDAAKKHLVIIQTPEAQRKIKEVLKALQESQSPTTKP